VRNLEIVKLPPYVCPARCFLNAARFVDLIKARVTIRLQSAGKVLLKGMSREKCSPCGSVPIFFSRHSTQLSARVLRFLSPVVPISLS
jgi:hypothetical protein